MQPNRVLGGLLALTMTLAACGSDSGDSAESAVEAAPAAASDTTAPPAAAPAATGEAGALLGTTPIGDALVGPDGKTLYGFTNDTAAASTCYGTCADAWPPVIVAEGWTVGPGLDTGIFATTVRDDGQLQLVAGKWPLYWFAGDAAPGDVKGQGSGDVWFVVDPQGILIKDGEAPADDGEAAAAAGSVTGAETDLGTVLVDEEGLTLYGFTNDADGEPTCNDDCADAWPPYVVDELPADLDPEVYSVVERVDGSLQLKAGKWPLYYFAGDSAPGDVNGQGSGDVWFAAAPDGSLVKDGAGAAASTDDAEADDDGY